MTKTYLVFLVTFILTSAIHAQESPWQEDLKKSSGNIYDIQKKFDAFWSNKEVVKGHGYKQFQRWMDFMEPRCFPGGELFDPGILQKSMEENPSFLKSSMNGNWQYAGNTAVPGGSGGGKGVGRINTVKEFPNQPGVWYACAPAGGLWRSSDFGQHWTVAGTDFLPGIGVHDVAMDPTNPDILYIATGDGEAGNTYSLGLLKSTNGGETWNTTGLSFSVQQIYFPGKIIISPTNPNLIHFATSNGLYRSTDAAATFSLVLNGDMREVHHSLGTAAMMFALDDNFGYYRSLDEGQTWTLVSSGLPTSAVTRMALAQSPANPNYVYIVACGADYGLYGIYRSENEGSTFVQVADNFPNTLSFEVFGTEAGGQGWYDLAICCDPNDPLKVYTGGIHIWKTVDGGITWTCATDSNNTPFLPYIHADIHSLLFIPGQNTLLVGHDGGVNTFNGVISTDVSGDLAIAQVRNLSVFSENETYIISGSQDTGVNLKDGLLYTHELSGDGMDCIIHPQYPDIMYAGIQNGQIWRTQQGSGHFDVIVNIGGAGVNENGSFHTPFEFGNTPNKLFIGKSKVYKSVDYGDNFTSLGAFGSGPIREMAVAPSNDNYIYASKNNSLYRTTNGNNFGLLAGTPNMYITDIEVATDNPAKIWITFSGFNANAKVYYSENAGANWTNLSTGLPNVPVNAIVSQQGVPGAIYIGTDIGVFYRNNELGTWIPFQSNLPNTVVTDLEIHYSTGKIFAGTYGRGIWSSELYSLPIRELSVREILQPKDMVCSLEINPKIVIRNEGSSIIHSATIDISSNTGLSESFNWTGNLLFGDTAHVLMDTMSFSTFGSHTLTFTVVNVNDLGSDVYASNNQQISTIEIPEGMNIPLTLSYSPLCNATGIDITIQDYEGNIIQSFEPFAEYIDVSTNFCLTDGCYHLVQEDKTPGNFCESEGGSLVQINTGIELVSLPTNVYDLALYPFCVGDVTFGCMDPMACNYEPTLDADDGSCIYASGLYEFNLTTDALGWQTTWNIINENNDVLVSSGPSDLFAFTTYQWSFPLDSGCYTLQLFDDFGNGIIANHGGDFSLYDPDGNLLLDFSTFGSQLTFNFCESTSIASACAAASGCTDPTASNYIPGLLIDDGSCLYLGCTDALACNFLDIANVDDGSCTYPGCLHENACNYDPLAGCDSGYCDFSCLPACPGDFDYSGSVSISDFIFFLSKYGCNNECGNADLDQSGSINVADLLVMITYLGVTCPY